MSIHIHYSFSQPPNSLPSSSVAESSCSFLFRKITTLCLSLQSILFTITSNPPDDGLSSLITAYCLVISISTHIRDSSPSFKVSFKQATVKIWSYTSLLKDCAPALIPIITKMINLSSSTDTFPLPFQTLFSHSSRNHHLKKKSFPLTLSFTLKLPHCSGWDQWLTDLWLTTLPTPVWFNENGTQTKS